MRIFNKNITSIFLMSVSLILLIGFNVFWIFKNYQEQKTLLQKDVDNALGKTIGMMQDSLIQNQIKIPIESSKNLDKRAKDTIYKQKVEILPTKVKNLSDKISQTIMILGDTIKKNISDSISTSGIKIMINPRSGMSEDSVKLLVGKLTAGLRKKNQINNITIRVSSDSLKTSSFKTDTITVNHHDMKVNLFKKRYDKIIKSDSIKKNLILFEKRDKFLNNNYVFFLKNDSLKIQEINTKYQSELAKNQIKLPFKILKFSRGTLPKINSAIITEKFSADFPVKNYYAVFMDYKPFLFRKIIPEILFSFFLIGITALTFGLIYRNLQKQKRLTELKNDFISNVTHELKTPISTVSVAIEALSNFNVLQNPNQTKEYLDISRNELNRLSMLVDKVLKMSIFEQKELELKTEEIDFKYLIENVLSSMKLQFEKHQSQVNLDFMGDDFRLKGDSIHLTNVVYNLLDNALKYSSEPQINVLLNEKESEIELSVKDNGQGIPKEYQQKIFEKFFRVPTGNIHTIKGYGLGLSYVWSVVEKHKGKISVISVENEGSDFTISLPKIAQ